MTKQVKYQMSKNEDIENSFNIHVENNIEWYGKALKCYVSNDCTVETINSPKIIIKEYFCQLFDRIKITLVQKMICATLWQMILNEQLVYSIQETPKCYSDKEILDNKNLVKSYIDCVLDENGNKTIKNADFYGGVYDEDGFIEFINPPKHKKKCYPLEIGFCRPTQFFYHLMRSHSIARLPYNHEYIIYFELVKPEIFNLL
jgi:hypothetical protein